jgi:hypothetical protein
MTAAGLVIVIALSAGSCIAAEPSRDRWLVDMSRVWYTARLFHPTASAAPHRCRPSPDGSERSPILGLA